MVLLKSSGVDRCHSRRLMRWRKLFQLDHKRDYVWAADKQIIPETDTAFFYNFVTLVLPLQFPRLEVWALEGFAQLLHSSTCCTLHGCNSMQFKAGNTWKIKTFGDFSSLRKQNTATWPKYSCFLHDWSWKLNDQQTVCIWKLD